MYWLKNTIKGQKKTPFVMVNGKQIFICQDIFGYKDYKSISHETDN